MALPPPGGFDQPPADSDEMVEIGLPSGASFPVHSEEVEYLRDRAERYLNDNRFSNVSDFQDLDRMLILELMCFRWGTWLSREKDYWGVPQDAKQLNDYINATSKELRLLKKQMGIDKLTRDREKGEDSVPVYINNLLARAKQFGVMREKQLAKALELFNQLKTLVTLHLNADEVERQEMHIQIDDILDWLVNIAFPEYDAIDAYFRENDQKFFIRKL